MKFTNSYIITIQFLGFRFHGWQKQKNVKSLHEMVDKTLFFVLGHPNFKSLGIGRTDAKVSANEYIFQLFVNEKVNDKAFIKIMNSNLPNDIRALSLKGVNSDFNIIKQPKIKEYLYFFSVGSKNHPFAAPFIMGIDENLDIELMKAGAKLFEGEHYFHKYCTKPSKLTVFERHIEVCEIVENDIYTANFFPDKSYVLRVKGQGFLRYQIRLIMGVLIQLGKGEVDLDFIKRSLSQDNDRKPTTYIAPSSGLQLYMVDFVK